jgi:hypothetical protein
MVMASVEEGDSAWDLRALAHSLSKIECIALAWLLSDDASLTKDLLNEDNQQGLFGFGCR